jgi:hypothetical protein
MLMPHPTRPITQKHSVSVRAHTADGSAQESRMSYVLAVVEDLIEKRGA